MSPREEAIEALQSALDYHFADQGLLEQALRHRSAAHEQGSASYERLEFLGDAALSHAVAALLFKHWPQASEGQLTRARAALVRERTLAELAERLGVGAAFEIGGGLRGEASAALLADGLEALLGALLLDGGWRTFAAAVRRLFLPLLASLDPDRLDLEEPKSTLQELAQARGWALPQYREVEIRGPEHGRTYVFEVVFGGRALAQGEGPSKRAAQQDAARRALETLEDES